MQIAEVHPDSVREKLSEFVRQFKSNATNQLIGHTICTAQHENNHQFLVYGASIPLAEEKYKDIWIGLSCVHTWHAQVSYTVMKSVRCPIEVHCEAYEAKGLKESDAMPPCLTCHELYTLPNPSTKRNPPGNCAETEAISELFKLRDSELEHVPPLDDTSKTEWVNLKNDRQNILIEELRRMKTRKNVTYCEFSAGDVYEPTPFIPKSSHLDVVHKGDEQARPYHVLLRGVFGLLLLLLFSYILK